MLDEITVSPGEAAEYLVSELDIRITNSGNTLKLLKRDGAYQQCRSMKDVFTFIRTPLFKWCNREGGDSSFYSASEDSQKTFKKELFDALLVAASAAVIAREREKFAATQEPGDFNFADIKVVSILGESNKEEIGLVDGSDDTIIDPNRITLQNFKRISKTFHDLALENVEPCALEYNPTKPMTWKAHYKTGTRRIPNLTHFNKHIAPYWKSLPNLHLGLPDEVEKIFSHMVGGDQRMLDYFYDATHYMIKDRLDVYLVLSGSPGIGKGMYARIMAELLGEANVKDATKNVLKSNFNDIFVDTRLVTHDEYPAATREEMSALKKNIESKQSIQKKFEDIETRGDVWASQIITVNKGVRYQFEPNERKFSVLDLTDIPLLDVMSETEIDGVTHRIEEDPEYLSRIGYFFLDHKPKASKKIGLKGDRFWDMCLAGLVGFNRFMVAELRRKHGAEHNLEMMIIDYIDSRGARGGEPPTEAEVTDHLKMWKLGGKEIAKMYRREGSLYLKSLITPGMFRDIYFEEEETEEDATDGFEFL